MSKRILKSIPVHSHDFTRFLIFHVSSLLAHFPAVCCSMKGVSQRKNHHLLTFFQIKTVPGVIRSCCLFLQVLMIVKKCLQTYYGIAIALENFLRHLKSSVVIRKIVTFCIILNHFGSRSGLNGYETQKITISLRFCL